MSVYAIKFQTTSKEKACTKIELNGYEISLAFDDSCGAMHHFERNYLCVYKDDVNVTNKFVQGKTEIFGFSGSDLLQLMNAIQNA